VSTGSRFRRAINERTQHVIVIGADTHKRNHTLSGVDGQAGAARGQRQMAASDAGALEALRFAAGLDEERVWAIEDCRHVSARLKAALLAAGERVIRVPAAASGQARRTARQAGKSDPIDARGGGVGGRARPGSTASPKRSATKTRWRSACCAMTAISSSASATG